MVGPYGLSKSVKESADNISKLDTGNIITYAAYITLGMVSLIFIVFGSYVLGEMIINPNLLIIIFLYFTLVLGNYSKINNTTPLLNFIRPFSSCSSYFFGFLKKNYSGDWRAQKYWQFSFKYY